MGADRLEAKGVSQTMSAKLNIRQVSDVKVVDVSGRITLGEGSSVVRDAVRELLAAGERKILLNMENVTYIDSSGIGELVAGYVSTKNAGATLKLVGVTKKMQDLLQITALYTVFDIHDDEVHAVRSFA
jgi:anti-sigma B factor antagonist